MIGDGFAYAAAAIVVGAWLQWFRLAREVRIPDDRTTFLVVNGAGVLIGIAAFLLGTGVVGGIAAGIAVVAGLAFLGLTATSG